MRDPTERDAESGGDAPAESSPDTVTTTPMLYDMMRESANRLRAALLHEMDSSTSSGAERVWRRHLQVGRELQAVDPDDRDDVIAHRRRWRAEHDRLRRSSARDG